MTQSHRIYSCSRLVDPSPSSKPNAKSVHVLAQCTSLLGMFIAGLVLVGQLRAASSSDPVIGDVRVAGSGHFDSDSLRNDGDGDRPWTWLSVPKSRLVLNPYTKVVNGLPPELTADLPLNVAYFVGRRAPRFDRVVVVRPGHDRSARFDAVAWFPHKLEQAAMFPGGRIEMIDFFGDEHTIVRIATLKRSADGAGKTALEIGGQVNGTACVSEGVVVVAGPESFHAIAVGPLSREGQSTRLVDVRVEDGQWKTGDLPDSGERQSAVVAVAFATRQEGAAMAIERVKRQLQRESAAEALARRKADWDDLLAKVPAPRRFGISAVSAEGVTPERHRMWYYGAWCFVLSQVLPPFPENGYSHISFSEGKPSRWCNGESGAPAQCAWTSFMVSGLMSFIWPDWAWDSYEGVMSRITAEGELAGESLPSRNAQAGWVLYEVTGDADRLRSVYPALKRYLIWREKNPRWILERGDTGSRHDFPDEKDSCFVVSHLIDVDYAIRIAHFLGLKDDVRFWQEMTERELANYRQWFFPPDSDPMNFYFTSSEKHVFADRTYQEPTYILTGLAFRGMPDDLVKRLQDYYATIHDASKPLVGFKFMKYGDSSFMAYGLLDRGLQPQANQFIDALLRDTILAGDFGEEQTLKDGHVQSSGVEPTLFLALQMIDFTLLKNGMRIDQGRPRELRAPASR